MPKGGKRTGAGRPRKLRAVPRDPSADPLVVERLSVLPPPNDLVDDEAEHWRTLAPLATAMGTLSASTVPGFRHLCHIRARIAATVAQIDADGWTFTKITIDGSGQEHQEPKRHPLFPVLQNLYLRQEYALRSFRLMPEGKAITAPQEVAPSNAWAKLA